VALADDEPDPLDSLFPEEVEVVEDQGPAAHVDKTRRRRVVDAAGGEDQSIHGLPIPATSGRCRDAIELTVRPDYEVVISPR
jgi:hypothetical protein